MYIETEAIKLYPYTVRRSCREERIPAFKFRGQWRFDKEKIKTLINSPKKDE